MLPTVNAMNLPTSNLRYAALGLLLELLALASSAQTTTGTTADGLGYSDSAGAVTITGYSGPGGAVTIPSTIAGDPVTSIGESAFQRETSLTSVTIPTSVTSIGSGAFVDCSGLTSITIPSSVTTIGDSAFSDCSALAGITIPSGVTSIGVGEFFNCSGLTSFTIPSSVTSIGDEAFVDCSGLTFIRIPSSVTSIGEGAFANCNSLNTISFLGNAPAVDPTAFQGVNSSAVITYPAGATGYTNPFAGLPTQQAGNSMRLINISTRAQVGTGGNILIPGFVIEGSGTETLLIRADGPSLTAFGVSDVLAHPSLSVFDNLGNVIASNTGWSTNTDPTQIANTSAQVGAFALQSGSADCAL